jgi:hypothetical protein
MYASWMLENENFSTNEPGSTLLKHKAVQKIAGLYEIARQVANGMI